MTLDVILIKEVSNHDYKKVYEGENEFGEEVIVKVYMDDDPAYREIYANNSLPMDITPEILECKKIGGQYFIVEEKVEGICLSQLDIRRKLAYNLGKVVAEIHNSRVLHGDLHSSNILVTKEGNIKVVDWEYSCFIPKGDEIKYVILDLYSISIGLKWRFTEFLRGYVHNTNYNVRSLLERLKRVIMKFGSDITQKKVIQKFIKYNYFS